MLLHGHGHRGYSGHYYINSTQIKTLFLCADLFPLSLFQYINITGAMGVPNVDITDPALLSACNVSNPGTCPSQLTITGASLSKATSVAMALAGMLVAVALQ